MFAPFAQTWDPPLHACWDFLLAPLPGCPPFAIFGLWPTQARFRLEWGYSYVTDLI
jgi:hypothetical protein